MQGINYSQGGIGSARWSTACEEWRQQEALKEWFANHDIDAARRKWGDSFNAAFAKWHRKEKFLAMYAGLVSRWKNGLANRSEIVALVRAYEQSM